MFSLAREGGGRERRKAQISSTRMNNVAPGVDERPLELIQFRSVCVHGYKSQASERENYSRTLFKGDLNAMNSIGGLNE